MNILEDTDLSNMTLDEARAVAAILKSPRCGVLTKKLCEDIAATDAEAGVFLSNMVQSIVSCMMKRNADTISNMRNTVFMLGRNGAEAPRAPIKWGRDTQVSRTPSSSGMQVETANTECSSATMALTRRAMQPPIPKLDTPLPALMR